MAYPFNHTFNRQVLVLTLTFSCHFARSQDSSNHLDFLAQKTERQTTSHATEEQEKARALSESDKELLAFFRSMIEEPKEALTMPEVIEVSAEREKLIRTTFAQYNRLATDSLIDVITHLTEGYDEITIKEIIDALATGPTKTLLELATSVEILSDAIQYYECYPIALTQKLKDLLEVSKDCISPTEDRKEIVRITFALHNCKTSETLIATIADLTSGYTNAAVQKITEKLVRSEVFVEPIDAVVPLHRMMLHSHKANPTILKKKEHRLIQLLAKEHPPLILTQAADAAFDCGQFPGKMMPRAIRSEDARETLIRSLLARYNKKATEELVSAINLLFTRYDRPTIEEMVHHLIAQVHESFMDITPNVVLTLKGIMAQYDLNDPIVTNEHSYIIHLLARASQ